jgi:flavin-dependent dehydrogenase
MIRCDILICGAGISGLLLASELSKSFSVVVLEKNIQSKCSNKFWLTRKECLEANQELAGCVDSEWSEMDFISNDRSTFTAKGRYILWNTEKLEKFLIAEIKSNGSDVLYEHRFYSYKYLDGGILSYANNSAFDATMLIDCMGYSSPIVGSSHAINILGYHHLYGRTMRLKESMNPIALDNVLLSGKPSYLEVFPKADNTANVVLISPAKNTNSMAKLERDFEFIVEKSHYSELLEYVENCDTLHGIVPIGEMRKPALNRVLFFRRSRTDSPCS